MYKDYSDALLREINRWGKRINRPVDTVYIGGGTPTTLTAEQLDDIFDPWAFLTRKDAIFERLEACEF